jgi:hypothetical protein
MFLIRFVRRAHTDEVYFREEGCCLHFKKLQPFLREEKK